MAAEMNRRAFEILVREHHRRLLGYALALVAAEADAEDLVQETFVTAWQRLDDFDTARPFGPWLRGILRHKYLAWRRQQRLVAVEAATLDALDARHRSWDQHEDQVGDMLRALRACVNALPAPFGPVVQLFYFRRLSGAQVASETGASEVTVRKRLQRARARLADCITARLDGEPQEA